MIVVLADDLSGAAEMGGMAHRHGLFADVLTTSASSQVPADLDVDVLVIDTDSRACSAGDAMRRVSHTAEQCRAMPVDWIFKKVDSVLRGHVVAELGALFEAFGQVRALLIPANPALGRTISDRDYRVYGQLLHETDFANDPEYPALTSNVVELLAERDSLGIAGQWPVCVAAVNDPFPERGIVVGETRSATDLAAWAQSLPADAISSGAADFFGALLEESGWATTEHAERYVDSQKSDNKLFVCGSTSAGSHDFCQNAEARGVPVLRLPLELLDAPVQAEALLSMWAASAVDALQTHPTVIIAIDQPLRREPDLPQKLTGYLGAAVEEILAVTKVDHLLVEGGATAAALIQRLGWARLHVLAEQAPGVVSVEPDGRGSLILTMKPGSYAWPEELCV